MKVAQLRSPPDNQPLEHLLAAIPLLGRQMLDELVARMIERMDEIDGDPDLELSGDELDGINSEDDFWNYSGFRPPPWGGAGCPISDPGGASVDDEGEMVEHFPDIPAYGVDQSAGAINGHIIGQRHTLSAQLADASRSGDYRYARQISQAIARLDHREQEIIGKAAVSRPN